MSRQLSVQVRAFNENRLFGGLLFMGRFPARMFAGFVGIAVIAGPGTAHGEDWGRADLSVRVVAIPSLAQPGQPIVYRVQVRNAGPGDAVLPVLRVLVPDDVDIVGVDVASCHPGRTRNEVVCPSPRDVLVGGTGAVTVNGIVRPGARGPLRAVATLTSEVTDEDERDNTASAVTRVDEGADLGLRLSGNRRGSHLALAAVVRNRGPRAVKDAHVFFRTAGARLVSATGARCRSRSGYVSCRLKSVGSGRKVRLKLTLRAPRRAVNARAGVFSVQLGDRRPDDNQARMRLAPR